MTRNLKGPYYPGQEQKLKRDFIKALASKRVHFFCIETAETVPGFPDVLEIGPYGYYLYELKVSDNKGVITFTRAQPLFYKKYAKDLKILICAWNVPRQTMYFRSALDIVEAKTLRYKLNG